MDCIDDINRQLFHEINFDLLKSQSNIYGVSSFTNFTNTSNKLLVSLLEGRVFLWEYNKLNNHELKCVSKEVAFTYIPGKCHIISVDSFCCDEQGLIVGVTFCKESSENFLNIYCSYGDDVSKDQKWNIDHVAQNRTSFELSFTPYRLTHCRVKNPSNCKNKTVFVLLGSDGAFHVYAQGEKNNGFTNVSTAKFFMELVGNFGTPTYLEIVNMEDMKRLTVIGNTVGRISVFLVDVISSTVISSWSIQHSSPIAQCCLFTAGDTTHLVVVSANELAVVYKNFLKNGFIDQIILEKSDEYDAVTSCAIADIDFDGVNEIIIGTYGSKALAYSFDLKVEAKSLQPVWSRKFSAPIVKLKFLDLTGDGINEMVVVTTGGIHIMQSNLNMLLTLCKSKLGLDKKV